MLKFRNFITIFERGRSIIVFNKIVKTCFAILLALAFLFYFHCFSQQGSITILEPKDKLITDRERLLVRGRAQLAKEVVINGLKVGVRSDGMFSAGLILHPGKNLLEIKAKINGQEIVERVRILREIKFPDVERPYSGRQYWARPQIISMSTLGIVEGYPDNSFDPKKPVSRGELATWVARAKDLIIKDLIEDVFFDVPKEHWRAPYISAAIDIGYMESSSPTVFGIGEDIKRGPVAKVIDKAEGLKIPSSISSSPFLDVPVNHPHATAIYAAFHGKMVIGVSNVRRIYQPDRAMNRAEAATLISRVNNVKSKLRALYDFTKDYDSTKLCRVNTPPVISEARVSPSVISSQSKTLVTFSAKITDLQGLKDISEVQINLISIGGPPDAKMYDDGTHDDEIARDGMYTLRVGVEPGMADGVHSLKILATDKGGWTGSATINLEVTK
ncbi:S-layer homology domain-containing protein [Candidatus Margulisiibacteriota bacterium]